MFELTELFKPEDFEQIRSKMSIPTGKELIEVTTIVDQVVFNGIKITLASDNMSLKIETASEEDKASGFRNSNKVLLVAAYKTRPDDPAGGVSRKPKVIIKP